eukprot:Skav236602  [mRNA]  locus=scaffold3534:112990:118749:+ [translate_table: standard]
MECDTALATFDRYVIYTDGTSLGWARRCNPHQAEELGHGDAWAFVVLGERYATPDSPGALCFLGWHAQRVRYGPQEPHHLGTDRIGSEMAEKEALTWAALWRLAQNNNRPTTFCVDSTSTAFQANGTFGTSDPSPCYHLMRGTFHALEEILPGTLLQIRHVHSHAGEPWNELVDAIAKQEAEEGFRLPRQDLDMRTWGPLLPHMWMLFSQHRGLPPLTADGFDIRPPALPPLDLPETTPASRADSQVHGHFDLVLASANVLSLSAGPQGHGGKVDYIREQCQSLGIHVLGIQESRAPESFSSAGDFLRFASGATNGLYGVELWVSTRLPYGHISKKPLFFHRSHFVVTHRGPRAMYVKCLTPYLETHFLVLHAPHTGIEAGTRTAWWETLQTIVDHHRGHADLIVLADTNATTGPSDHIHVLEEADHSNVNTPLLRAFLEANDLYLPATSAVHTGTQSTWQSPDGLSQSRIDYVMFPRAFHSHCVWSGVVMELDIGGHRPDHFPIAAQLRWDLWLQERTPRPTNRRRFRGDRSCIKQSLDSRVWHGIQVPGWHTDIEHHVDTLTQTFHDHLSTSCRRSPDRPKKSYITDELWSLRKMKLSLSKQLRVLHRGPDGPRLRALLDEWLDRPHPHPEDAALGRLLDLRARLKECASNLQRGLQKARQNALHAHLQQFDHRASAGDILKSLYPYLGSTNPKKHRKAALPLIRDADGQVCLSQQATHSRWLEFSGTMEGGSETTLTDHLAQFPHEGPISLHISQLPSLVELEGCFRRVAAGKAVGLDGLPPEMCRHQPGAMAKATYSTLMKLAIHGQESLDHKGGKVHAIWKHKGDRAECSSYRSILVSSHFGKVLHRCLRQKQYSVYESYLRHQQIGGRQKMPVTVGVHQCRAYLRTHRAEGHSVALVFLDLRGAFYRVIRPIALGGCITDEHVALLAHRLSLGPDALHDLRQLMTEPSALDRAGMDHRTQNFIRSLHSDTWFFMGDGPEYRRVTTTVGTRPGDSFADVVFGYAWSRILASVETDLLAQGLLTFYPDVHGLQDSADEPAGSHIPYFGPTWMDDTCIALAHPDAGQLEKAALFATGLLLGCSKRHGMEPNLQPGKTELLLAFQGRGSRAAKLRYHGPQASGMARVLGEDCTYSVHVVGHYTHLGCTIHHDGSVRKELKKRLSIAHQSFQQHRRALYCNRDLTQQQRTLLFDSVVLSKLLYGTESWILQDGPSRDAFHSGLVRLYRRLLRLPHDGHYSDEAIFAMGNLPSPTEVLRRSRLRYLATLYHCGRSATWGLLRTDEAWTTLIKADMQWMWDQLHNSTDLPPPDTHLHVWEGLLRFHPQWWKKLVKRAVAHAIGQRKNLLMVTEIHHGVLDTLREQGSFGTSPPTPRDLQPVDPTDGPFGCMACEKRCKTYGGEGAHMFRVHKQVSALRYLFDGTSCPWCLKEYHSHSKLHTHLRNVEACRTGLQGRGLLLTPAPGAGSTQDRLLQERHDGLIPVLQAAGPSLPLAPGQAWDTYDHDLYDRLSACILDHDSLQDIETAMRATIRLRPISWTLCSRTLRALCTQCTEEDAHASGIPLADIRSLCDRLASGTSWSFLQSPIQTSRQSSSTIRSLDFYDCEEWCVQLDGCACPWLPSAPLQRPFFRERIILHAFAGRRRLGDVQWFLDAKPAPPGTVIVTVSLDIVICEEWGNIADASTRNYWLNAIKGGKVLGLLCGPPCNTWSRARGVELDHVPTKRLPRVIRHPTSPWGDPSVALRELNQLLDSNLLLGFALEAFAAAVMSGAVGLVEHPAPPDEADKVSIWKLPLVHLLRSLPGVDFVELTQGKFGAPSPKPTALMTANLAGLPEALTQWQLSDQNPKRATIGTNLSGGFNTSPLKEYPPAMCKAIAEAFWQAFDSVPLAPGHIDAQFMHRCSTMVVTDMGDYIGPDTAL